MVALSLASATFGPRVARNFVRRPSTHLIIGAFVATFVYSLVVLTSVFSSASGAFIPLVSTWSAVVAALAAAGLLVWWIHDLAFSIQIGNVILGITGDLARAIDDQQRELARLVSSDGPVPAPSNTAAIVLCPTSGYIQVVRHNDLVRAATTAGAVIHLEHRAGEFALAGTPLARVDPPEAFEAVGPKIQRAVVVGAYRTLEQDLLYAIDQLVEIAVRALSPGVNDPFTAIMCIDWLADGVSRVEANPVRGRGIAGSDGTICLVIPAEKTAGIIDAAFDQIQQAAVGHPVVTVHLLTTMSRLAPLVGQSSRDALRLHADTVVERALHAASLVKDINVIEAAHRSAITSMAGVQPA